MPSCVQILKERDVGGVARLLLRQLHVWGIACCNCGNLGRGIFGSSIGIPSTTVKTLTDRQTDER